jgi:enamine deaminase RidA (YjgF/YER057c/UK114 family)
MSAIAKGNGSAWLELAIPTLAGSATECLLDAAEPAVERNGCGVFESAGHTAGFAVAAPDLDLEAATHELYQRMFAAIGSSHLYRIWNYVPHINATESGLENYRRFSLARSEAFEARFGAAFQHHLPAASGVGLATGTLAIAFLAGECQPRHFENPHQIPAFEYPADYGPRPPSFSRATLVDGPTRRELFISGTAAIRGHATISPGDLGGQLACTRENLHAIAQAAGAGADFGARDGWQRALKVYVRHASDFPHVRRDLETHLLQREDRVTYLQADLCRAELLVEIEAVLTKQ